MSEVVNVGRLFRDACRPMRVQPCAVQEYMSRVVDHIGDVVPVIVGFAEADGRKTVYEEDVIRFFSMIGSEVVEE